MQMLMKRTALLIILSLILLNSYSQDFINYKFNQVKNHFYSYCSASTGNNCSIIEKKDTLEISITNASTLPLSLEYYFNKKGRCIEIVTKLSCDSCSEKFLHDWLYSKKTNWHAIDSKSYISGMGKNLYLNIISSRSFSVKRLSPREFVLLRNKARG